MASQDRTERPRAEHQESLWVLAISPLVWAAHFMACYLTAAIWCAKQGRGAELGSVRLTIAAYTAVAMVAIAATAWMGWRRHRFGSAATPHDLDTPADRQRFLGFATLLLSALSGVATLYVALTAVFFETCR